MIYTTGTVNTVSGSAIVRGTGTKFKNNNPAINIGMTILIKSGNTNIPYMIKSVNSDTELVLAQPALATATNTTFSIHITEPDNNSDAARTMVAINSYTQYFLDSMNTWMTETGQTKIEMPNGEVITLDSIKKMQEDISRKLSPGDFGLGTNARGKVKPTEFIVDADSIEDAGFFQPDGGNSVNFLDRYAPLISMVRYGGSDGTGRITQIQGARNDIGFRTRDNLNWTKWFTCVLRNSGGVQSVEGELRCSNAIGVINKTESNAAWISLGRGIPDIYVKREGEVNCIYTFPDPKLGNRALMGVGDYGVGGVHLSGVGRPVKLLGELPSGFYGYVTPQDIPANTVRYGDFIRLNYNSGNYQNILMPNYGDDFMVIQRVSDNSVSNVKVMTSNMWTTDSNGFYKRASPIIDINASGAFTTNDESEGATVTRVAIGEYLIEGVLGFNSDAGWGGVDGGIEIPLDVNKQPLIWVDSIVNEDGSILVKTYHRTHPNAPEFANNKIDGFNDGDPIDIPDGRFISVRVQMPEQSIYNVRMHEMEEAQKEEEDRRQKEEGMEV